MGLRADVSTGNGAVFSEDVLKIEVYGPDEDYLTIIDVPGIFRTTTEGTTKNDIAMVKDLVTGYVKDDRTIILAVLPSNVDIATQEILELAGDYDKNGERTLGVLTKPDLVLEPSAQASVCDLVQGKKRPLTLGYFLVRNHGGNDCSSEQSELEQMFKRQPWSGLPRDRVGISALKEQLSTLLLELTRREFPKLLQEVSSKIRECKRDLHSLGPPRQDDREQRNFLSHIAGAFQDHVRAALAADYNADPVFDRNELRLITQIVNITDVFSADLQQSGHSQHFQNLEVPRGPLGYETPSESVSEETPAELTTEKLRELLRQAGVDNVAPGELAELGDIIVPVKMMPLPHDDFTTWINDVYLQSRGLDLGNFNANFVSVAFAEQSRKWDDMTKIYMSRVILTLHRFTSAALRSILPEEQARGQLWSTLIESLRERYKLAMVQASLLIEVERRKQPYTLNRQFARALSRASGQRTAELLRPKARKDTKQYGEVQNMVNLLDIAEAAEGKQNAEQLQERIHDILHAYYGIALDRFIDNVFRLAVDHHLLHGPCGPLKVFTHDWVISLVSNSRALEYPFRIVSGGISTWRALCR